MHSKKKRGFSTLRKWAQQQLNLTPGILGDVLDIMKLKAGKMSPLEFYTILSFDELYIKQQVHIIRYTCDLYYLDISVFFIQKISIKLIF